MKITLNARQGTMTREAPATAEIVPQDEGGLRIEVKVPTYSGGVIFPIDVQRDADGDWRVFLPDVSEYSDEGASPLLLHLGAPDVPREPDWTVAS